MRVEDLCAVWPHDLYGVSVISEWSGVLDGARADTRDRLAERGADIHAVVKAHPAVDGITTWSVAGCDIPFHRPQVFGWLCGAAAAVGASRQAELFEHGICQAQIA